MAWRIHTWDEETGTGEVVSPHFGPWRFGTEHNPWKTTDFVPGEEVVVELDGPKEAYVVRSVVRVVRRRETLLGMAGPVLDPVNETENYDMHVMEESDDLLRLWLGTCCATCHDSWTVTFRGVHLTRGLDDDLPCGPVFQLVPATAAAEHELDVPAGCRVYRIIGIEFPADRVDRVFIVAAEVTAEWRPAGP